MSGIGRRWHLFLSDGVGVVIGRISAGTLLRRVPVLWGFAHGGAGMFLAVGCFVVSLCCAGACFRSSKAARWYVLPVLVMIMVAVLFGSGGN